MEYPEKKGETVNNSEFYRRLANQVADQPTQALTALQAVTEGLAAFEEEVRKTRDSQAANALVGLLSICNFTKRKKVATPYAIDAAFYLFPEGPANGGSKVTRAFWNSFIAGAKDTPVDRYWLECIKGYDYAVWWDAHVAPCIKAALDEEPSPS